MGQDKRLCKKVMASSSNYGGWLGAEPARTLGKIVVIKEDFEAQDGGQSGSMEARGTGQNDEECGSFAREGSQSSVSMERKNFCFQKDGTYASGSGGKACMGQSVGDTS